MCTGIFRNHVDVNIRICIRNSGAGKSTLLECLIGRRGTGLTGTITVKEFTKIKIAFIPQVKKK